MDIRTGKTYQTYDEAIAAGVPASDIARVDQTLNGEPRPSFVPPPKVTFTTSADR